MEVIICPDEQAVGRIAAERIARVLAQAKTPVLGVATGSTPLTTYSSLAVLAQEGKADFTGLRAFALDEYVGLPAAGNVSADRKTLTFSANIPAGVSFLRSTIKWFFRNRKVL